MGLWGSTGSKTGGSSIFSRYRSMRTFTEKVARVEDLASIEIQGGEVSACEVDLRGISNGPNAQMAAARLLAALSHPLATFTIVADRSAWAFRPGTPFKFSWPKLGIENMRARVLRVGSGTLASGKIRIEAIEDAFGSTWLGATPPPASGWTNPAGAVPALVDQAVIPAPYEAVKGISGGGTRQALIMAIRGTPGTTLGYDLYLQKAIPGTWFEPIRVTALTPAGVLSADIDELSTEIVVAAGTDLKRIASASGPDFALGTNVLWLVAEDGREEFVAFADVSGTGALTIEGLARGCLDTAPTPFLAGTRVWFMSYGNHILNINAPVPPATTADSVLVLQPYNRLGGYEFYDIDEVTVTSTAPARSEKVYCPTDVQFNGASYPPTISGELAITWSHRNRLGAWSYADSGKTTVAETGTEYDILVYGETDTLIHTETGLTGTSWTYASALEISESGLGRLNTSLRVVIVTYGDSRAHESIRQIEWAMDRV